MFRLRLPIRRLRDRYARWLWYQRVRRAAGAPDQALGAGETLRLDRDAKSIRIAPSRLGEPVASFWSFWHHGDEIYAAGRNHVGVHKLSFHSSGQWHSALRNDRKDLAPGKPLPGGRWLHALQLRYLVGDPLLNPLPEKPFREADPGYCIESPPGQYVVVHLLIGREGTELNSLVPNAYSFPRLLPMKLRSGQCAILVGGPLDMEPGVQRDLALARAVRIRAKPGSDLARGGGELFQVQITESGFNRVSVIPLGSENFTTAPPPPDAQSAPMDWFTG